MANLAYGDWFVPFDPPRVVHPYLDADALAPRERDDD
jgi:hypothetical protein